MNRKSLFVIASCAGLASSALGGVFNVNDGNSSASFDTDSGQISWIVDGVSQVFAQEFYYRLSTDTREYRVDETNLNLNGAVTIDTNPFTNPDADAFSQLYSNGAGLEIETLFTLRGGTAGSGTADLAEQIVIRNTTSSSMTLSFFQYVDFDLGGNTFDDFGEIINGNTVRQSDGNTTVSETVVTPSPTLFQVDDPNVLTGMFDDNAIDSLDGTASAFGDVAWAFQWNITLGAGDTFIISKDKLITPTPGSLALLGAAGLFGIRRRR